MNAHIRDNLNFLNDLRVEYAQLATNFGGITSAGSTVLTAPSFTPINGSRLLKITGRWRSFSSTVADDIFAVAIHEVGVGRLNEVNIRASGTNVGAVGGTIMHLVASPTITAHTYALTADRQAGSGTGTMQGAAAYPIQLIIEDVGAA